MDAGKEMISGGIDSWIIGQCDSAISASTGVTLGNSSTLTNASSMERLTVSIATYNQNPYQVAWIRDEVKTDYTIYYLSGLVILIFAGVFFYAQIAFPEAVGGATELILGYERYFYYKDYIKTLALLIILPTALPFVLNYSIDLEQAISDGIMIDSLKYIQLSNHNIILYIIQAISYLCALLFVYLRVLLINIVCAKVLIIVLILCIPWDAIRVFATITLAYFYTALFMRPVMLWITGMSVKMATNATIDQATILYTGALVIVFVVCVIATLWPLIYVIIKILTSRLTRTLMRLKHYA
jgi:hypothetical protein